MIQRYWTNFARTGDPNQGGSDPVWPRFTTSANVRLNLAPTPITLTDFRKPQCAFWQLVYSNEFGDNPTAR
jgi:carboxylesterase type B